MKPRAGDVEILSLGLSYGATFSVKLPFVNLSMLESVKIEPLDRSVQPNCFNGITLLVVDDEADSLDILTLVLQSEGADVISVASAQTALKVLSHITKKPLTTLQFSFVGLLRSISAMLGIVFVCLEIGVIWVWLFDLSWSDSLGDLSILVIVTSLGAILGIISLFLSREGV